MLPLREAQEAMLPLRGKYSEKCLEEACFLCKQEAGEKQKMLPLQARSRGGTSRGQGIKMLPLQEKLLPFQAGGQGLKCYLCKQKCYLFKLEATAKLEKYKRVGL
jgi:hypothetical protein